MTRLGRANQHRRRKPRPALTDISVLSKCRQGRSLSLRKSDIWRSSTYSTFPRFVPNCRHESDALSEDFDLLAQSPTLEIGLARSDATDRLRAGFWRRVIAYSIDAVIAFAPLQIMAAVLFWATAGWVQLNTGVFLYPSCEASREILESGATSSSNGAKYSTECTTGFLGFETGRRLIFSKDGVHGPFTTRILKSHLLDTNGRVIQGYSLGWLGLVALAGYVLAMETWNGATIGSRVLRIRVVDVAEPNAFGVSYRKIIARYLAMLGGLIPMLIVGLYSVEIYGSAKFSVYTSIKPGGVPALPLSIFPLELVLNPEDSTRLVVSIWISNQILAIWCLVLIVQIACKRDPYYDRIAGTAVLRSLNG